MVSWGDGEESSTDPNSLGTDGPNTMYDSDYSGLADDGEKPICCKCNSVPSKFVAFEGCWTGIRFLACSGEFGETCDFVQWVDPVWPSPLCKSLSKLWEMYTEVRDGLDNVETRFKFTGEIAKLHRDLRNAQDEFKQVVEEKQVTLAHKRRLEYMIEDLLKQKEGFRAKIKKIKDTCDE